MRRTQVFQFITIYADVAQLVEHVIGKQNCPSSWKRDAEARITVNVHVCG